MAGEGIGEWIADGVWGEVNFDLISSFLKLIA